MLVTFSTKSYADITMFGDIAKQLIAMMGHSGSIPSAIVAEDVPAALQKLESAIARHREPASAADDDSDEEPSVSLAHRAIPLIELLEAAAKNNNNVMWDSN